MDIIKYCGLARSNKKSHDYIERLDAIYRDETAYVSTDGHRLHYVNNQPKVIPHYIDAGKNEAVSQFPVWKPAIPDPNTETASYTVDGFVEKSTITRLKNLYNALKDLNGNSYMSCPCRLRLVKTSGYKNKELLDLWIDAVSGNQHQAHACMKPNTASFLFAPIKECTQSLQPTDLEDSEPPDTHYDLNYLIDALVPNATNLVIKEHGYRAPLTIEQTLSGNTYKAVIMPRIYY